MHDIRGKGLSEKGEYYKLTKEIKKIFLPVTH